MSKIKQSNLTERLYLNIRGLSDDDLMMLLSALKSNSSVKYGSQPSGWLRVARESNVIQLVNGKWTLLDKPMANGLKCVNFTDFLKFIKDTNSKNENAFKSIHIDKVNNIIKENEEVNLYDDLVATITKVNDIVSNLKVVAHTKKELKIGSLVMCWADKKHRAIIFTINDKDDIEYALKYANYEVVNDGYIKYFFDNLKINK